MILTLFKVAVVAVYFLATLEYSGNVSASETLRIQQYIGLVLARHLNRWNVVGVHS